MGPRVWIVLGSINFGPGDRVVGLRVIRCRHKYVPAPPVLLTEEQARPTRALGAGTPDPDSWRGTVLWTVPNCTDIIIANGSV